MKIASLKVSTIVLLAVVSAIAYCTFSAGHGVGHLALREQAMLTEAGMQYSDSHVDVIYERTFGHEQDWLHLEIDTTYHKVGKGNFTYKTLCNRRFSLRAYGEEYESWGNGYKHCFIEGQSEHKWSTLPHSPTKLLGYEVQKASSSDGTSDWEVWYTEQLPEIHIGSQCQDDYKGLILYLSDLSRGYTLEAKHIDIHMG